jgi:hypothetical protein
MNNVQMLEKKLLLIEELAKDEPFRDALILATVFHYFHYDVKRDLKKENCDAFKLFVEQASLKDVSCEIPCSTPQIHIISNLSGISHNRCTRHAPRRIDPAVGW